MVASLLPYLPLVTEHGVWSLGGRTSSEEDNGRKEADLVVRSIW
jgi:hypothetical protein